MKNKKILSILTGSMLLMMHNSQSFFAEANDMSDSEDTGIIAKSLAENQSSKNTSILNNIKLTIEKEHLTLKVNLPQNYTLNVIESQDELTHFDERDSEFILKFNYESLKNSNVNIKLFENKQTIFEVDLEKLMDYLYENEIITNNSKENDGKLDLTLLDLVNSILPTDTIELEDTSSEDSDSEDTSPEDTSSEDTSSEDSDFEDTSSEDSDLEDTSSEDTSSEDTSSEDSDFEDTSSEDSDLEDTSSEDSDSEDTSSEDLDSEDTSSEDSDSEDTSSEDPSSEKISTEDKELTNSETEELKPKASLFSVSTRRVADNGVYTVKSGDTFNNIASSFGLSYKQLEVWNYHVADRNKLTVGTRLAINKTGVERMLSAKDKARLYKGGAATEFKTNQEFINTIAPIAIEIANQAGAEALWPSIMIAQAAHESNYGRSALASSPYFNLMGIKGSHNGNSTLMWTWEVRNGVRVNELAAFRDYPSYTESLRDYANLMRNGVSWYRGIYSGTWRSNSTSAWNVLENGGLSAYATDPNYFAGLRRMMNTYDLTKHDLNNFNRKPTSYYTFIGRDKYSIDSKPWGVPGYENIARTDKYIGRYVYVSAETSNGAYALISVNGQTLGWVDKNALGLNYDYKQGVIVQGNFSIDSLPWGTVGYQKIGSTSSYLHEVVDIVGTTHNGSYVLIRKNGKDLGWVDYRSVAQVNNVISKNYVTYIGKNGYSIDTKPWGVTGFEKVGLSSDILGQKVQIIAETSNGSYALIAINGKISGWIDKNAFGLAQNYNKAVIIASNFSVDSLPWGIKGYKKVGTTTSYLHDVVDVVGSTHNGSYVLIRKNGNDLGWVDHRSITQLNNIVPKGYTAYIGKNGYSVDTKPWGVAGFEKVASSTELIGQKVEVVSETSNGSYALISINGEVYGWIDKNAFGLTKTKSRAVIIRNNYSIDSLPWGIKGFRKISTTNGYLNQEVNVLGSTPNGSYVLIEKNGKEIGWVDYRAISFK